MGRAIAILVVVVIGAFAFVFLNLLNSRGSRPTSSSGPRPLLSIREDGSLYSVGLHMSRLEQRLQEEERRSGRLIADVNELRAERDEARRQVESLQAELRRLRQEFADRSVVPPPALNGPVEPGNGNGPSPIPPDGG